MKKLVTVYAYTKWDGEKYVIRRWATEEAIKIFEAVKVADQYKQVEEELLDDNGRFNDK